jgi:hypothetical protein
LDFEAGPNIENPGMKFLSTEVVEKEADINLARCFYRSAPKFKIVYFNKKANYWVEFPDN